MKSIVFKNLNISEQTSFKILGRKTETTENAVLYLATLYEKD